MFSNRQLKKAIIILCLLLFMYFGIRFYYSEIYNALSLVTQVFSPQSYNIHVKEQENLQTEAPSWAPILSHLYSCPACFGYNICEKFTKGTILFHGELPMAHNTRIMWKKGVLESQRVVISSLTNDAWIKFDEFVCRNASLGVPCNLASAIPKTVLSVESLLSLEKFRNLNSLLDIPLTQFSLPVCSTKKLVDELMKSFDENLDGLISKQERILLLTTLIMQPGYAILKLQTKTRMSMPIPNLLGACGRSVILEGGMQSLRSFLSQSFEARAGLAVQVLQLVEDFEEEDPQWYFLYLAFSFDTVVVTNVGEVVVIDLDNLVILDKSLFPRDSHKQVSNDGLCNEICFQKMTLKLLYNQNNSSCSHISQYGQLMYAVVCKQMLSNIEEHKAEGFFNFDGHRLHRKLESPGLLHSIPSKTKDYMEGLLRECVQETKPSGRRKAIFLLREALEKHASINESGGYKSNGGKKYGNINAAKM